MKYAIWRGSKKKKDHWTFSPKKRKCLKKKKRGAAKKDDEKKKRHRISTYLTDKQYKQFMAYCEDQDLSPAEAVRMAIRETIGKVNK